MTDSATIMRCEDALRLLAMHLDRELPAATDSDVERHLALCRSCYSRAEFERRLKTQLGALGAAEVPASLETRIRRLIAGHSED